MDIQNRLNSNGSAYKSKKIFHSLLNLYINLKRESVFLFIFEFYMT
jgi:hypothetical protein